MKNHLRGNLLLFVFTVVICSVLYPTVMYALGRGLFPTGTSGGLINDRGESVREGGSGSHLIAQPFTSDEYFWPRPSAASYNATASGGSNFGANNPKLRDRVAQMIGPMVVYKSARGAGNRPQQDIEAWFAAVPDRAATWATDASVGPANWANTDLANDKYGLQGGYILNWAKDHPEVTEDWKKANPDNVDGPKPEEIVGPFFASFSKVHPAKWPGVAEVEQPDKTKLKRIVPVATDAAIAGNFFDLWLSDPTNATKVADSEPVVADMVTASGSGLDPHITARNALSVYQLDRIARKRSTPAEFEKVKEGIADLIRSKSFTPLSGLIGEELVNVLELNIELNKRFPVNVGS